MAALVDFSASAQEGFRGLVLAAVGFEAPWWLVVVLSAILGRTPTMDEYKAAVEGIKLTKFAPPLKDMTTTPTHLLSF